MGEFGLAVTQQDAYEGGFDLDGVHVDRSCDLGANLVVFGKFPLQSDLVLWFSIQLQADSVTISYLKLF